MPRISRSCVQQSITAILAAAAVTTASAAESPQADELEEVTVTAQFREQRLQDTPLAITAVSGALLEQRSQTNLVDVGAFAPSVNLAPATSINANAVAAFIRGIGQEDSNFALEPGVGIYVDDVYYGTTFGAALDLVDLDRVEVLRGPQGTLSGKNSLGGAIRLFSREPDADGGGSLQAEYGSYNRLGVRGTAGFTVADGLYGRVSGSYRRSDGFFKELDYGCVNPTGGIAPTGRANDNCVLDRAGSTEMLSLRGALRWAPSDLPIELTLLADMSSDDSGSPPNVVSYANFPLVRSYVPANPFAGVPFDSRFFTPRGSYSSYADFGDSGNYSTVFGGFPTQVSPGTFPDPAENSADGYGFSANLEWRLSDSLSLRSITAYRSLEGTAVIDIDGSPLNLLKERLNQTHRQFTQELRLSGRVNDFADFTVGAFYYDADSRMRFRIQIPIFLYDFQTNDPVSNRSVAGFAHVELHATDRLDVIGGLRYTSDRKVYTFGRVNADGTPISGIPLTQNFLVYGLDGLTGVFDDDRVDYRIGANYRWTDDLMTYLQVSTGYKGGGVNPRPFVPDQVLPFDPETLTTYEFGLKSTFADNRVRANLAVFYNEYDDIQRTLYVCPSSLSTACSLPANAGSARSQGAELELSVHPTTALSIDATVNFLDFEYRTINPATGITLDMVAPFSSDLQASAGIQYDFALANGGHLTPRVDWSYISSFYYNSVNAPLNLIPSRGVANARVTWTTADDAWEVSAAVTNFTDRYYYTGAMENVANFGLSTYVTGRPREWMLSVRRNF